MPRQFDNIWEAVESILESCERGDLTDRLSQERHEERQRHEVSLKQRRRETIEECAKIVEANASDPSFDDIVRQIRALAEDQPGL